MSGGPKDDGQELKETEFERYQFGLFVKLCSKDIYDKSDPGY